VAAWRPSIENIPRQFLPWFPSLPFVKNSPADTLGPSFGTLPDTVLFA